MGVQLGELVVKESLEIKSLAGKRIAIDAYNTLYQFLSIIRQRDGTPLMDSEGRITSHLSGILYRTARLMEVGIKPVYVFDGKPPQFKEKEIEQRMQVRQEARERWKKAKAAGELEDARKYAQASSRLTKEMVAEGEELLKYMGIPVVQAPSEGEAQAAYMTKEGIVDVCSSQDYDSLLFGAPCLVRNLTVSGRRKLPGKSTYVEVEPERIELEKTLNQLGIDRKRLIWMGILMGTDYNKGVKGIGPKKALKIVKEAESLEQAVKGSKGEFEIEPGKIEKFFLQPPVEEKIELKFGEPDVEKIKEFLCKKHDFSESRVRGTVEALAKKAREKGQQSSLGDWV